MRLDGPAVLGAQHAREPRRRRVQRGDVALLGDLLVADDAARAHRLELLGHVRQAGARRPRRAQRAGGADRVPLALGHDGEEALDADDAGGGNGADGRLVHADQRGADRGRPDDARVHHAGQRQVVHVEMEARDLGRDVGPPQRLADEAEVLGRFHQRLGIELHVEPLIADEVAVGDRRAAVLRAHDAVGHVEIGGRLAQLLRGLRDQRLARGGGGLAELRAAARDAVAARRRALVGRERGIALDHRDALGRDVELLGDDLAHGDAAAGADVHLADEDRQRAVGVHGQIGIDEVGRDRLAEEPVGARHALGARAHGQPERDHERAAGGEEGAAREHQRPPCAAAARRTARMTRTWLPQRQRLPASASRTCGSVGCGIRESRARAVMIMPAVQ